MESLLPPRDLGLFARTFFPEWFPDIRCLSEFTEERKRNKL